MPTLRFAALPSIQKVRYKAIAIHISRARIAPHTQRSMHICGCMKITHRFSTLLQLRRPPSQLSYAAAQSHAASDGIYFVLLAVHHRPRALGFFERSCPNCGRVPARQRAHARTNIRSVASRERLPRAKRVLMLYQMLDFRFVTQLPLCGLKNLYLENFLRSSPTYTYRCMYPLYPRGAWHCVRVAHGRT